MHTLPHHIAFIMDGNSRWATAQGLDATEGHKAGVEAMRKVVAHCGTLGIPVVTVFAFSRENWQRSQDEVDALMQLFIETLETSLDEFVRQGVGLKIIGQRHELNPQLIELIQSAEEATKDGRYTLVVALNYSGRQDIAQAAQRIAQQVADHTLLPSEVSEASIAQHLSTANLPPLDLCIRTSNEHRISNFMLWQLAYTELYFCDTLWPDFGPQELDAALANYASRQRRFGTRLATASCDTPNPSAVPSSSSQ